MTQAAGSDSTIANPADAAPADPAAAAVAAGVNNEPQPNAEAQPAKTEHELEVDRLRRENAKLQRRIDRRTHALGEAHRELAMSRNGQPSRAAPQDDDGDDPAPAPAVDTEERARELAADMRRAEKIALGARSMLEAGTKLDKEFRTVVSDLARDLPLVGRDGRATEFAEVVLECDNPAAVLLHIARNDDTAEVLQGLTGPALGRKLAKIEAEVAAAAGKPQPSNAPRPLDPLRPNAGAANEPRDSDTPEEWRRKEVARLNAKRAQPYAAASR